MTQSAQNLASHQTTSTFCRHQSKQNPENMFESIVDDQNHTRSSTGKSETTQKHASRSRERNQEQLPQNNQHQSEENTQQNFTSPTRKQKEESDEVQCENLQEFHSYMDLTSKLQSTLNKISTRRSANTTSRSSNIIQRFEQLELKKKQQIRRLRELRDCQTEREIKGKPTINKHSEMLAKQTKHQPIHVRFEKIMESKKKQQELNQELKKKQLLQQQASFFQEFQKHCKKPENVRSYDQYFNEMVRWKEKRMEQNRLRLEKKKSDELQQLSFHPEINNKSKKMMEGKQRLPISERGLVRQKVKPLYTFTPSISSKQLK